MIKSAIEVYNKIYVSTAKKSEFDSKKRIDRDLRYTNSVTYKSDELKKFVIRLSEKGILDNDC